MNEISAVSWPWYITGPLLGAFVPLLLILNKKQLGVSSGFRAFWAWFTKKPKYFDYDYAKDTWQLLFGLGVLIAGLTLFLSNQIPSEIPITEGSREILAQNGVQDFSGLAPSDIYSYEHWWILLIGGLFIGFGARLGNGCTAGHCIMGVSQFSLASIVTTVFFFVGGLIATYFIIPYII